VKKIQILGTGCPRCEKLTENARAAADLAGVVCEIEKVTDVGEITRMGVMLTPALAIEGSVKAAGRVPDAATIEAWLRPGVSPPACEGGLAASEPPFPATPA